MLKATVILFCYNQEATVGRAIESVLRQRCDYPYEILVADDGSPDGTRRVCEEYASKYPDLIRMLPAAPNKGLVDNYYDAVAASRGEYVADCAGDDEWGAPDRLQRCIELLDRHKDISVVYTDTVTINEARNGAAASPASTRSSGDAEAPTRRSGREILLSVLNHVNSIPYVLSSALYKREPVARALSESPRLLRCPDGGVEDVPLIAFLGSVGDAMHLPIEGYRYYISGESVSNNLSDEKDYWFTARVSSMTLRLGRLYQLTFRQQRDHFRAKFNYMAAMARRSGNRALLRDLRKRRREWGHPLPLKARLNLLLLRLGYRGV